MRHSIDSNCGGWTGPVLRDGDCQICWKDENPTTLGLRSVVDVKIIAGVQTAASYRPTIIQDGRVRSISPIQFPCIYLGDVVKQCSRGNTHHCNYTEHEWRKCTPSNNVDLETRSCWNCPHHNDGAQEDGRQDVIAGPEIKRDDPVGWCRHPATQAAHTFAYKRFLEKLEEYPNDRIGRGYIVVGGGKYAPGIWLQIRMLREVGSDLPVQIWHRGGNEEVPLCIRLLRNVEVIDATKHPLRDRWRVLGGWQLKMIAGLNSGWKEWVYSDSDNYPVANPEMCFDHNPTGGVLWPDLEMNDNGIKWQSYGVTAPHPNRGTNGGSAIFDLSRCWRALNLAHWFDMHSEYYYKPEWGVGGYGDQDQIRTGFVLTKTPYTLYNTRPKNLNGIFLQPGPNDQTMFIHRIHDKPSKSGLNRFAPQLPMESEVHRIMKDYRE